MRIMVVHSRRPLFGLLLYSCAIIKQRFYFFPQYIFRKCYMRKWNIFSYVSIVVNINQAYLFKDTIHYLGFPISIHSSALSS